MRNIQRFIDMLWQSWYNYGVVVLKAYFLFVDGVQTKSGKLVVN